MTGRGRGRAGTGWRTGRSVGRTIYDADDNLIGMMDSSDLASAAVDAVNSKAGKMRAERDAARLALRQALGEAHPVEAPSTSWELGLAGPQAIAAWLDALGDDGDALRQALEARNARRSP